MEPDVERDPAVMEARVRRFVEARNLLPSGPLVVAVSGGQDSVAMLDLLRRLSGELGIEPHVAHLNHMFRGAQADSEARFVGELAARWGLEATVGAIDVPAYGARHRLAKPVAARYARYRFLAGVAARVEAGQVAVGHTADDAVETLLMNLLRGSGLAGLRGILPRRDLAPGQLGPPLEAGDWHTGEVSLLPGPLPVVVRPLLDLFRSETETYCRARGLTFHVDPTNLDTAYRRSRVRAELLPALERFLPGVRERLRDTTDLLADEYQVVLRAVDGAWVELARMGPGRVEFDLEPWNRLEAGLARQLLRRAFETLAGSLEDFGRAHVDACGAVVRRGRVGARVDLPAGLHLEMGYTSFRLARGPAPVAAAPVEPVPLAVPGWAVLGDALLEAELRETPAEGDRDACRFVDPSEACLDADLAGPVLLVRHRRPGDRFVPLGMAEPKKLHDFMVDEKIPRQERDLVPLVATPDRILWVAGHRIDERFKVTAETRRILRLRLRRQKGTGNREQGAEEGE